MYLMTGRPILMLRCQDCKNWFHANISVQARMPSVIGVGWQFEATFNRSCSKDDLNSIFRCDCLARQVFLAHSVRCDDCFGYHASKLIVEPPKHKIHVRADDTLHVFIMRLTKQKYNKSNLPAYTLQRRCGAVVEYLDRYMKEVMTPAQAMRTLAYRKKRLEIREGSYVKLEGTPGSAPSTDPE
jgi:hypothetical protein